MLPNVDIFDQLRLGRENNRLLIEPDKLLSAPQIDKQVQLPAIGDHTVWWPVDGQLISHGHLLILNFQLHQGLQSPVEVRHFKDYNLELHRCPVLVEVGQLTVHNYFVLSYVQLGCLVELNLDSV